MAHDMAAKKESDDVIFLPKQTPSDLQYVKNRQTGERISLIRYRKMIAGLEKEFMDHISQIKSDVVSQLEYKIFM